MIAMSFLSWIRLWMNVFGISTTVIYMCSCASMMHVSSTDSVVTVGELASSLEIKYIYFLPPATVLPLMIKSLF